MSKDEFLSYIDNVNNSKYVSSQFEGYVDKLIDTYIPKYEFIDALPEYDEIYVSSLNLVKLYLNEGLYKSFLHLCLNYKNYLINTDSKLVADLYNLTDNIAIKYWYLYINHRIFLITVINNKIRFCMFDKSFRYVSESEMCSLERLKYYLSKGNIDINFQSLIESHLLLEGMIK